MPAPPLLSSIVVCWRSREDALALAREFPDSGRHELLLVDNSDELPPEIESERIRRLVPGRNLGFAGGANLGAREARAARLLFLNPDVSPLGQAFDDLVRGFETYPEAAGLAPRLVGADGRSQCRWQLRRLPRPAELLAHAFFWNPARGPRIEPAAGAAVEQPAAAALALRREVFDAAGGFDEGYAPAWFEDVDLARRLAERGARLRYWPEAGFRHRGGASVANLGYGGFLVAYDRNLARYLGRHHGRGWALAFRLLVPFGALARLLLLPARRPRRAASRAAAARALVGVAAAAWRGWAPSPGSG